MYESFNINATDPTPLYAQLERAIRFAIATGRLRIGEQLPTVRQMAVDLKINANTVAKVYAELERAGVVETRRGVGTFILARQSIAASREDLEKHLSDSADRFLTEAASFGFSVEDVIEHLEGRRQKEKKKYG
jgi:GntR family transcriptional regulator